MSAATDASGGRGQGWNGQGAWRGRGCGVARGWHPVELLAVVLGFMVYWPIGVAVLGWKVWQRKTQYQGNFASFAEEKWRSATQGFSRQGRSERWRPFSTGNMAFDDWRTAELSRLEEERRRLDDAQREFAAHLDNLRRAKDREEFDRFMAERQRRNPSGSEQPPAS